MNVKNAILLYGVYSEDLTLTADKEYLVTNNLIFSGNSILTINPGTTIKIGNGNKIGTLENAKIIAIGNKEQKIKFINEDLSWAGFELVSNLVSNFDYCEIIGFNTDKGVFTRPSKNIEVSNSLFSGGHSNYLTFRGDDKTIINSNYYDNTVFYLNSGNINTFDCNFIGNTPIFINEYTGFHFFSAPSQQDGFMEGSNIFNNQISFSANFSGVSSPLKAYLGTYNDDFIRTEIRDLYNSSDNSGLFNLDFVSETPSSTAHSIVWKILVNGKDAQDEYDLMEPVGVGSHEFKVYFNREMDTSVDPQISYGVREPYNQKIISEQGTWSTDGKIYTVTHDVNIGAADGINRIRVQDARDLDYFDIPVEDSRFNMLVQSAGSASTGFIATAGLGEITLDWTAPSASDLDDVLGYNMYRYTANEDGTFTDPVKINESLVTDITFKDYDVARDTQYFYKYKILRTSFEETDYSNAVSSQLLTAALGDSNGDSSVNVMDVVNTVDHILGNNPTPFVDYATDVNNDSSVNVLDVVGIVDMVLNPTTSSVRLNGEPINYVSNAPVGEAELFWRDNDLYVKTDKPISGLQLSFDGDLAFTASELLEGYELNNFIIDDKRVVMAYSFDGFQITPGTHKLLSTSNKPLDVTAGAMATSYGESIFVLYNQGAISHIDAPLQTDKLEVLSVSPNPSNGLIKLHYYLPQQMDNLSVGVFDLSGRLMWNSSSFKNTKGHARASLDLQKLSTGTYIMMINANRSGETKFNHTTKIVIE